MTCQRPWTTRFGLAVALPYMLFSGVAAASGSSGLLSAPIAFPVGLDPVDVAVADLNNDGNADLVVANGDSDDLSVLLGTPTLAFEPEFRLVVGNRPTAVAVADFDGDDRPDIAAINSLDDNVTVFLGNAQGGFHDGIFGATLPNGSTPQDAVARDFTGDTVVDLAVVLGWDDEIHILPGAGDGTFGPPFFPGAVIQVPSTVGSGAPRTIFSGDLNADGDDRDFLVPSDPVAWSFRNANGTWTPSVSGAVFGPTHVTAGDVNGDAVSDLVSVVFSDEVVLQLGNGDGSFAPAEVFFAPDPDRVLVVDLNGDGLGDIVTASDFDDVVAVLLADPKDTFLPPALFDAGTDEFVPAPIDVDNDGDIDLAVVNRAGSVAILVNQCVAAPVIVTQPASLIVDADDAEAVFSAIARGTKPLTYQWRFNGQPLADGNGISGATTDTLTISDPTAANAGSYEVHVVNSAGSATSDAGVLGFLNPFPADFNGDGFINANDLSVILANWGPVP